MNDTGMVTNKHSSFLAVAGLVLATSACAPVDPQTQRVATTTPNLWVWWIHGTEGLPFERLVAQFKAKFDIEIEHPTSFDSQLTRERAAQELALAGRSHAPTGTDTIDGLQANAGHDLRRWAHRMASDSTTTNLLPLDDYMSADIFWPEVACEITAGGKLIAIPLNVHRDTGLYISTSLAPHALASRAAVLARGVRFAARHPWEVALVVFENWLIARKGAEFYRTLFGGHGADDCSTDAGCQLDAELRSGLSEVLDEVFAQRDLFATSYTWDEMVTRVAQGSEVGLVMGSWAPGFVKSSINACGRAIACPHDVFRSDEADAALQFIPTPGTEEALVYTSDVIAVQRGTTATAALVHFASFATEPDVQGDFSALKGSMPAVRDLPSSGMLMEHARGDYYQFAEEAEQPQTRVLGMSGLCPPEFNNPVQRALWCLIDAAGTASCDQLRVDGEVSVETVVRVIEAHYDHLTAHSAERTERDECVSKARAAAQ